MYTSSCTIKSTVQLPKSKIISLRLERSFQAFLNSQCICRCTSSGQMVEYCRPTGHQDPCTVLCNHADLQNLYFAFTVISKVAFHVSQPSRLTNCTCTCTCKGYTYIMCTHNKMCIIMPLKGCNSVCTLAILFMCY